MKHCVNFLPIAAKTKLQKKFIKNFVQKKHEEIHHWSGQNRGGTEKWNEKKSD